MSIWSRIFGRSSAADSDAWLVSCPLCKKAYRLGVDAYLVTRDDILKMAGGARMTVGNLSNVFFSADAVYSIEGTPSENDQEVLVETRRKLGEIANAIAIGERRSWFCRRCGGPDRGEHPYPLQIDASPEIARLTRALASSDSQARWDAVRALRRMKDPRVLAPLVAALADDWTAFDAEEALCESHDPRVVESLARVLVDMRCSPKHREAAAKTLGKLGRRVALEPLAKALGDEEPSVRDRAACALAEAGSVKLLIESLKNPNRNVREAAAYAIGSTEDRRVIRPLIASLKDKDCLVRRNAASSLGYFRDPEVVNALVATLKDTESCVRDWAIGALGKIGDKSAVIPLISALADRSWSGRYEVCRALGGFGDIRAVDALIDALKDEDDLVKKTAAQALSNLADPRGVAAIRDQGLEVKDTKTAKAQRESKILGLFLKGDFEKLRQIASGLDEEE